MILLHAPVRSAAAQTENEINTAPACAEPCTAGNKTDPEKVLTQTYVLVKYFISFLFKKNLFNFYSEFPVSQIIPKVCLILS